MRVLKLSFSFLVFALCSLLLVSCEQKENLSQVLSNSTFPTDRDGAIALVHKVADASSREVAGQAAQNTKASISYQAYTESLEFDKSAKRIVVPVKYSFTASPSVLSTERVDCVVWGRLYIQDLAGSMKTTFEATAQNNGFKRIAPKLYPNAEIRNN